MKKLNILGHKVAVKIKKLPADLLVDGRSYANIIEVDPEAQNPTQVYFHEVLHQIFDRLGVYRTDINKDLEHILIDAIATVLSENRVIIHQHCNQLAKLKK